MSFACVAPGPVAKKMKKGKSKRRELTKEEQRQKQKDLKTGRQQAERKDMFDIICQAKQIWGNLRRYTHTHTQSPGPKSLKLSLC